MNESAISYVESLRLDPYPSPDYRVICTLDDMVDYTPSSWVLSSDRGMYPTGNPMGCDTESLPDGTPFCLTYSIAPGTGRLIYAKDKESIRRFGNLVRVHQPRLLLHNYLHDVGQLEEMGVDIPNSIPLENRPVEGFSDTLVRSYNLCLGGGGDDEEGSVAGRGSLGLKVLAYRLLNMRMTSFKDTVTPHSIPKVLSWLHEAEELFRKQEWVPTCSCGCPVDLHQLKGIKRPSHTGPCSNCNCSKCVRVKKPATTPQDKQLDSVYTKVTNLTMSLLLGETADDGSPIDPWKRVKDWKESYPLVTDVLGPIPPRSIAHVPEPELLFYACRDADAALRLHLFLKSYCPWIFYR